MSELVLGGLGLAVIGWLFWRTQKDTRELEELNAKAAENHAEIERILAPHIAQAKLEKALRMKDEGLL